MTGHLLPVFKSSQQEKVPLQPFRAPAAGRDGVREKEFHRKSLLQEKGEYYLWKDKESKTFISRKVSLEEADLETGEVALAALPLDCERKSYLCREGSAHTRPTSPHCTQPRQSGKPE